MPAHGNGMIRSGSLPGTNAGGTGRPPSVLRERLRGSFADRVSTLEQIADGSAIQRMKIGDTVTDTLISADVPDRLKAIDLMAKYGLGTQKEVTVEDVRDRLTRTLAVIREEFGDQPDKVARTFARLRPVWA